nr:zinc finger BED domain-containing protein RICESLEEPER 2-like [Tanacetum cinerariifolium]
MLRQSMEGENGDEPSSTTSKRAKRAPLDQEMSREKMTIRIIKPNYPFIYVEREATRQLQKFLHRDAIPICKNSARSNALAIHEREKTNIKMKLEKYNDGIIDYSLFKLEMADEVRQVKVDAKIDSLYELYSDYEFNIDTMHDSLGARNENANDDETMDELDELVDFESFPRRFK